MAQKQRPAPDTSTAGAFDMVGNLSEWSAELIFPPPGEFGTPDNAGAMALGEDFNNTGGGTPRTNSLLSPLSLRYQPAGRLLLVVSTVPLTLRFCYHEFIRNPL